MHIAEDALQRVMGQLVQRDLSRLEVRDALGTIISGMPGLFDVDGAGVLLIDENQVLRYVASTDPGSHLLEAVQESTGQGPCVEALIENVTVAVDDLLADDRWPGLADLLVPNGVRAVLGAPIHLGGTPIGSLNVYTQADHAWDDSDRRALADFNRLTERLLAGALRAEHDETLIGQLHHALQARVVIERAVGYVMASEGVDATTAFERIRRAARSSRRTAQDVAGDVVRGKRLD